MSGNKQFADVCWLNALAVALLAQTTFSDEPKPRVLTEGEAATFSSIVVNRETKRQNFFALERLIADKQALFKKVSDSLAKDHQVKTDASYTYVAADKTLYLLSTNGVARGKEPKKTVVAKFKNEEDSLPLRKLMATRLQAENQLAVLNTLAEENRVATLDWDAHLRTTFGLKPSARYEVKKRDDGAFELVELPPAKEEQHRK